jgi:Zn ribbon nucleic-acid-binding protein
MLHSVTPICEEPALNDRICVLCAYYHPRADPHAPDRGQTCIEGRRRLEHELLTVRAGYLRLLEQHTCEVGAKDAPSQQLPAATVPSPGKQPMVSGTKERRILLTDASDLTAAAQVGSVADPFRDQVGYLSIATVLNEWIRAWRERYFANQRRPGLTAVALIDWLIGVRLDLVCDADTAIADFADELHDLRAKMRHALGESKKRPQPMWGVICPRCKLISQLMLDPEDPRKYRECDNCGKLLTEDEYHDHLRKLVEKYRARP